MNAPFAVTIVRTRKLRPAKIANVTLRRPRRESLGDEPFRWLMIKLACLGLLTAISVWLLLRAVEALGAL